MTGTPAPTWLQGPIRGSVALVTGAGGGIGAACARALAHHGVSLGLIDTDRGRVEDAAAEARAAGVDALVLTADASDPGQLTAAVDQVGRDLGNIGIAVSTVAHEEHGGLLDSDRAALRRSLEVTVGGAFTCCRLVADRMIRAGNGGRIVLIGSLHASLPFAGAVTYNTAEAALRHLARTAAHELAAHRVAVNLVEPGWIDTPGERRWYGEDELARAGAAVPFGRLGTPDDVAQAVLFLASPAAAYVTGATIRVDGGLALSLARLPTGEGAAP